MEIHIVFLDCRSTQSSLHYIFSLLSVNQISLYSMPNNSIPIFTMKMYFNRENTPKLNVSNFKSP